MTQAFVVVAPPPSGVRGYQPPLLLVIILKFVVVPESVDLVHTKPFVVVLVATLAARQPIWLLANPGPTYRFINVNLDLFAYIVSI